MSIIGRLGWAVAVAWLGQASRAEANFVTYVFTGTGSGTLGSRAFTGDSFTITVTSDTSAVTPFSFTGGTFVNNGFSVPPSATTINLVGVGTAIFSDSAKVFDNNSTGVLGLQSPSNSDYLDLNAVPPFDTYDLRSSLGPIFIPTPTAVDQFQVVATTRGLLSFSSISDVTFVATVVGAVVPGPPSLALCGVAGVVGVAIARSRRERAA